MATLVVCFALALLVVAGTVVDLLPRWRQRWQQQEKQQEQGREQEQALFPGKEALLCFSFSRNWAWLMAPGRAAKSGEMGPRDKDKAATAALDGIRALSITWVVFIHVFLFAEIILNFGNTAPDVAGTLRALLPDGQAGPLPPNSENSPPGFLATVGGQAITGAYFAVDTFLFLSGILAVRGLLLLLQRRSAAATTATTGACIQQAPVIYLLRYLRLTPAYALVLFLYWPVLGALGGKGPVWRSAFVSDYGAGRGQGTGGASISVDGLIDQF